VSLASSQLAVCLSVCRMLSDICSVHLVPQFDRRLATPRNGTSEVCIEKGSHIITHVVHLTSALFLSSTLSLLSLANDLPRIWPISPMLSFLHWRSTCRRPGHRPACPGDTLHAWNFEPAVRLLLRCLQHGIQPHLPQHADNDRGRCVSLRYIPAQGDIR
jgi:hypothetical protein